MGSSAARSSDGLNPAGLWMTGTSSDLRLSYGAAGIENDVRWRRTNGHCEDSTVLKDDFSSSSGAFSSRGMLENEWYLPSQPSFLDEMRGASVRSSPQLDCHNLPSSAHSGHHNGSIDPQHLQALQQRNFLRSRAELSSFLDGTMPLEGYAHRQTAAGVGGLGSVGLGRLNGNLLQQPNMQLLSNLNMNTIRSSNLHTPGGTILNRPTFLDNLTPSPDLRTGTGIPEGSHHQGVSLSNFVGTSNFSNLAGTGGFSSHGLLGASNAGIVGASGGVNTGRLGEGYENALLGKNFLAEYSNNNNSNCSLLLNLERSLLPSTINKSSNLSSSSSLLKPSTVAAGTHAGLLLQQQQTLLQKRAAAATQRQQAVPCNGPVSPTTNDVKSPLEVAITSVSNDSSVNTPEDDSPGGSTRGGAKNARLVMNPAQSSNLMDLDEAKPTSKGSDSDDAAGTAAPAEGDFQLEMELESKDDEQMEDRSDGSDMYGDTLEMEGALGRSRATGMIRGNVPSASGTIGESSKGKGKLKGMPAKNLMAERRRRKKLNDRLYMLRSVVPKITKMDRASILGDAIDYLKELLERIDRLSNELEGTTQNEDQTQIISNSQALEPPGAGRVKEENEIEAVEGEYNAFERNPSVPEPSLRVDMNVEETMNAFNIHMFCSRRPGILLSTMRALEGLGLEVQQAVVSCFNGFALDIFRAELMGEGEIGTQEVRAVLLHAAAGSNIQPDTCQ
ncbi:hypothetical protein R1flu_016301 [Riccia fluitans]|uniref:BHLH domain-containing protein n=1 Tax=Riccia fluitans TaxID=41844 RepID=A0ABD1YMA1_9MARC